MKKKNAKTPKRQKAKMPEWPKGALPRQLHVQPNDRGFREIYAKAYLPPHDPVRIVTASSAINSDYDNAFDLPGSSYLWIGDTVHLNREAVVELVEHLRGWLKTGCLR